MRRGSRGGFSATAQISNDPSKMLQQTSIILLLSIISGLGLLLVVPRSRDVLKSDFLGSAPHVILPVDSTARLLLTHRSSERSGRGGFRFLKKGRDGPDPKPGPSSGPSCQGQCGIHNQNDDEGPCGGDAHEGKCGDYKDAGAGGTVKPCYGEDCPWKTCSRGRCNKVCDGTREDGEVFRVDYWKSPSNRGKRIRCFNYYDPNAPPRPPAPPLPTPSPTAPTMPTAPPTPPPTVAGEKSCRGQCGNHNKQDKLGPCGALAHEGGSCGYPTGQPCTLARQLFAEHFSDRTRCIAQLRPGCSFPLSALQFL